FTVVELVVALAIVLSIAAALAQAVAPSGAAFERIPAETDIQQRGRTAIELLAESVRSAVEITLVDPDAHGGFGEMTVVVPVVNGALGISGIDQASSADAITLDVVRCPNIKEVCGFTSDAVVLISDGTRSEIFIVSSVSAGARQITPDRALSQPYPAGSTVTEVEAGTFSLALQPDGSRSLIRETAAGAIQPAVDFLESLRFSPQSDRIDIALTARAPTSALRGVVPDRIFRTSIRRRNAS
ncbi:MAG TPA: hypothetical protein VEA16_13875, partial [Vicinamibacterales bacterium]|nr:hypothetical protein [Vicinamibacterales bacterium]